MSQLDRRSFCAGLGTAALIPVCQLDEDTAAAVAGLEVEKLYDHFAKGQAKDKGTVTKVKLADKGIKILLRRKGLSRGVSDQG